MLYLITYELRQVPLSLRNLALVSQKLDEVITSFGVWWHYMSHTWIVETTLDADDMVKQIRQHLSAQDFLFVVHIQPPYQGWLPGDAWEWLNERMRSVGYIQQYQSD